MRLLHLDGTYVTIFQQSLTIHNQDRDNITRDLTTHTDISNIIYDRRMRLSLIGLDGEPSYENIEICNSRTHLSAESFTVRETEVLRLLAKSHTTPEIADKLHICPETVKSHRKNLLMKTQSKSTVALLMRAVREGWV